MNLPTELKARIYDHIGTVQKHLGELPSDEQREILQSLEAHIHDALEARSGGQPTLNLLEAILAEIDPPESYGQRPTSSEPPNAKAPNIQSKKPSNNGFFKGCLLAVLIFIAFIFYYSRESSEVDPSEIHPLKAVEFTQGANTLKEGNSIVLNEVMASSPYFAAGDVITVAGQYTLSTQPNARLALFVTATHGGGRSSITKEQQVQVSEGSGSFQLTSTIPYQGSPHLTFYDITTGSPIGGIYFGLKEQVDRIEIHGPSLDTYSEPNRKEGSAATNRTPLQLPKSKEELAQLVGTEGIAESSAKLKRDRTFKLGHDKLTLYPDIKTFHADGTISGKRGTLVGSMHSWKENRSGDISVIGLGGTEWRLFKKNKDDAEDKFYRSIDWYLFEQ